MAKASAANQPKKLASLVKRLALPTSSQKDERGKELIQLLSVPTKAQKTPNRRKKDRKGNDIFTLSVIKTGPNKGKERKQYTYEPNPLSEDAVKAKGWWTFPGSHEGRLYFFNEDPKLMQEFIDYNKQDVVAEIAADNALPELPDEEQALWALDRKINMRGIPVDLYLCRGALKVYEEEVALSNVRIDKITDGEITRVSQVHRIIKWLTDRFDATEHGFEYEGKPSTRDPIIPNFLRDYRNPETWDIFYDGFDPAVEMPRIREILELRELAGGTAVAKYKAAIAYAQTDDRVRDQLLYHGAATGRWTAKGIQPHNMKREKTLDEVYINAIKTGNHATVGAMGEISGYTVMDVLKKSIRGLICAPKGKKLVVSDFAGIEARVLHWLVGGEEMLELFRQGQDIYIHGALEIYECSPEDIATWSDKKGKWVIMDEHTDKRAVGKEEQLGLGYGMGHVTFQKNVYDKAGIDLSEEFAKQVVDTWRETNPKVVKFWYDIEKACKLVITNHKKVVKWKNGIEVFFHPANYLCIRLPSGRVLYYFSPWIDREAGYKLFYMDGSKMGKRINRHGIDTYSGKICENVIQGIARDLLVSSMFIVADAGLDIVFHVHDEIVVEADSQDVVAYDVVHNAMSFVPSWAEGLPLMAESYEAQRYTK